MDSVYRLASLGVTEYNIHRTRFRRQILASIPDLVEVKGPSGYYNLVFDEDITAAIEQYKTTTNEKMLILAKAAKILREENLNLKHIFTGSLDKASEKKSTGSMLLSFSHMLLDGPRIMKNLESKSIGTEKTAAVPLYIAQIIAYNMAKRRLNNPTSVPRHLHEHETSVVIYNAAKVYLKSGKEELVSFLHREGLAISIDRLRTISVDLANSVIEFWNKIGVVVPLSMKTGYFTTHALDNVDHNPTSTTAKSSYHGTGISCTQHCADDKINLPLCTEVLSESAIGRQKVNSLPSYYTNLPEIVLSKSEAAYVPKLNSDSHVVPASPSLKQLLLGEYQWLDHAHQDISEWISWAAYHASISQSLTSAKCISQMLPLFPEYSNSPAMIYQGMTMIAASTKYLNPDQVPVMVVDQPLFTISKRIQWKFPHTHGEEVFVVMLGGLHMEYKLHFLI